MNKAELVGEVASETGPAEMSQNGSSDAEESSCRGRDLKANLPSCLCEKLFR